MDLGPWPIFVGEVMNKGLMFPDELFSINEPELYKKTVSAGRIIAKQKKILFCGIGRNVGEHLERNILRMHCSGSFFQDYHIFIYENDSTDNTREVLNKYAGDKLSCVFAERDDKNYVDLLNSGQDPVHYNRCKVLANCRNEYLKYAQDRADDYDTVCVVDLDLWGGWSYNGFLHSVAVLYNRPENGAVTAYGVLACPYNRKTLEESTPDKYIMYDCFVFRPKGPFQAVPKPYTARYNFIRHRPGDNVAFVNSNFNGLGIYKSESLDGLEYGAKLWNPISVDADHVVLHRQMIENGWDIIFNPSMLVSYANHEYSQIPLIENRPNL